MKLDPAPRSPDLVPQLVRSSMSGRPDAIAVSGITELSYAELERLVARYSGRLRACGVTPGALVGIAVPKSAIMIAALLAIWDCGAVGVPLPDSGSSDRVVRIIRDCDAFCVLATSQTRDLVAGTAPVVLDDGGGDEDGGLTYDTAPATPTVSDPAYVIYTSGSTGTPKGVVMSHGAFANVISWQRHASARTHRGQPPRALQFTPLTFDVSYLEIFACLAAGGTLLLPTEQQRHDPVLLFDLLARARATTVFLPHVMLHAIADVAVGARRGQPLSLRELATGGEQLIVTDSLRDWFRQMPGCRLRNIYGPTETHVVTMHELAADPASWPSLPPIGRAIPGAFLHILDDQGADVPAGQTGELCIAGPCLADGYLHRPDLTAQRFPVDPRSGARRYHSGDLVRDLGNGVLQYVSRVDDQIKIRGALVDPSGVEALLAVHPDVEACAVTVRDAVGGDKRLVAYVVPRGSMRPSEPVTRQADPVLVRHLHSTLPEWSIPDTYVYLPALPVGSSGKIDRSALPEPSRARPETCGPYRPARTQTQLRLVAMWSGLLQLDDVGTADRFFDLGGHSLLIARLQTEISREFADIGVAQLMEHPTIEALATYLDDRAAGQTGAGGPAAKVEPDGAAARRDAFRARGRQRQANRYAAQPPASEE